MAAKITVDKTFDSMGHRESAYGSNLVPDISEVKNLVRHQGGTNLWPLEDQPPFVENIYIFGYLLQEDIVFENGRVSCTTGYVGSACRIVRRISMAVQETIGKRRGRFQTNIMHTVSKKTSGAILSTINQIEHDTNAEARKAWCKRVLGREDATEFLTDQNGIAAVFVAKVDVSEIPIVDLQRDLPAFARELLAIGYGIYSIDIYSIDYAQDRPAQIYHLIENHGKHEQGDERRRVDEEGCSLVKPGGDAGGKVEGPPFLLEDILEKFEAMQGWTATELASELREARKRKSISSGLNHVPLVVAKRHVNKCLYAMEECGLVVSSKSVGSKPAWFLKQDEGSWLERMYWQYKIVYQSLLPKLAEGRMKRRPCEICQLTGLSRKEVNRCLECLSNLGCVEADGPKKEWCVRQGLMMGVSV